MTGCPAVSPLVEADVLPVQTPTLRSVCCLRGPWPSTRLRHDPRGATSVVVLRTRRLQKPPPGGDSRPAPQQCSTLAFGHSSPHTEFNALVQGVRETLGPNTAAGTQCFGLVLRRALDEQVVGIGRPAQPLLTPTGIRHPRCHPLLWPVLCCLAPEATGI